ncbi:DUF4931 domain-containing protein [Candidatus Uhrbacteria bacterium]|nr:DUF4931 domain-containing protein [Candidatus Uhrbacteria bacterium]
MKRSEIRKDYIQEKYVIVAPRRAHRPTGPAPACAFCDPLIGREKAIMTVGDKNNWRVKVLANKFPSVTKINPKAYGIQEIVVEAPDHRTHLEDMSEDRIAEVLDVYAARTAALSEDPKVQYIMIFKNNGGRAGASMSHAHSQIFSTDFIPPHLLEKSEKVFEYRLKRGTCVYCDILAAESRGPRRVYAGEHVVAFTPYASMHNYELWILPRRHFDNITDANDLEKREWAKVLKGALEAISALGLPYNYYFHQVIEDNDQHLYMKITPRGSTWAGVEIGSGIIINPVPPEDAAKHYRKAMGE